MLREVLEEKEAPEDCYQRHTCQHYSTNGARVCERSFRTCIDLSWRRGRILLEARGDVGNGPAQLRVAPQTVASQIENLDRKSVV